MLTKPKIWIGAGVVAAAAGALIGGCGSDHKASGAGDNAEGGEAGAYVRDAESAEHGSAGEAGGSDFPGESFDQALTRVLSGEGGQSGLGISRLQQSGSGYSFSVPALNASQVKKALSGNSLRRENHFAIHFTPQGQYRGWSLIWTTASMDRCPSREGPGHGVFADECWVARANHLEGAWSLQGDLLCLAPPALGFSDGQTCVRSALVLNSIILFAPDGSVVGKGGDLRPGVDIGRKRMT